MSKVILGVFEARSSAESAITELESVGLKAKDISIMMKDTHQAEDISTSTGANVADGAVSGATTGGVIGGLTGLLIGIGAITIPGIGAVLIAGPIAAALGLTGVAATTLSGALTGALAGGFLGALIGLGVPEADAKVYEERIRAGAILLAVPSPEDQEDEVKEIMEDNGAVQLRSINASWNRETRQMEQEHPYEEHTHQSPSFFSQIRRKLGGR